MKVFSMVILYYPKGLILPVWYPDNDKIIINLILVSLTTNQTLFIS